MINSLHFKRNTAIVYFVMILIGSSIPGNRAPDVIQLVPDKILHVIEYLIFGFLLLRWFEVQWSSFKYVIPLTIVVGMCCGALDEFYQYLIPNRNTDFYDWCIDTLGVTLGTFLYTKLR